MFGRTESVAYIMEMLSEEFAAFSINPYLESIEPGSSTTSQNMCNIFTSDQIVPGGSAPVSFYCCVTCNIFSQNRLNYHNSSLSFLVNYWHAISLNATSPQATHSHVPEDSCSH